MQLLELILVRSIYIIFSFSSVAIKDEFVMKLFVSK
jgi:hypothetical protein